MPSMVTALKTVAESVIGILTLLLQVFVQQLERQDVMIEENNQELEGSTGQQLNVMMVELQNQRQMLESLMSNIKNQPRQIEAAPSSPPQMAGPRGASSSAASTRTPSRAAAAPKAIAGIPLLRSSTPSTINHSWVEVCEPEEEELVVEAIVEPAAHVANHVPPLAIPLPGNLTLEERGAFEVNWGRKHRGRTFAEVLRSDPGYVQWSIDRYNGLSPEQKDFVRYCRTARPHLN